LRRIASIARSNSMTVNTHARRNELLAGMQRQCKRNLVQRGRILRGAHNRGGLILLTAGFCGKQAASFRRTGIGLMAVFDARWNDPYARSATTQPRAARSAKRRDEHSQDGGYGNGAGVRPLGPVRGLWHPYSQRINATPMNTRRQSATKARCSPPNASVNPCAAGRSEDGPLQKLAL